jgi:hypothetical protein
MRIFAVVFTELEFDSNVATPLTVAASNAAIRTEVESCASILTTVAAQMAPGLS